MTMHNPANTNRATSCGVLVIGHGTRDPRGVAEFLETTRLLAARLAPLPVEPAFLELAQPTIAEGWRRLVARGPSSVLVSPLLLFAAGHAKRDIPAAVAEAASEFPAMTFRLVPHLGCHPALIERSADRVRAALANSPCRVEDCLLVVAGRGSRDSEATAETEQYARLVATRLGAPEVRVGFLAMAEPRLTAVLDEAATSRFPSIVVLPHLLFHGELLTTVQSLVRERRSLVSNKLWFAAEHLGPEAAIDAVVDRLGQENTPPSPA